MKVEDQGFVLPLLIEAWPAAALALPSSACAVFLDVRRMFEKKPRSCVGDADAA